jgi:D-erythronate 2-dehydrogenase
LKTVIIGAGGFVGRKLAEILSSTAQDLTELILIDQMKFEGPQDKRVRIITGDFADPAIMGNALKGADSVVLLAAILGGAAEANYALSRKVNIDGALTLIEYLRDQNAGTRLVFASTIAIFSKPMPSPVTDLTPTGPSMIYGAQKLMMEVAISNFAAKGWLDGVSLRPSGVMARDGADARLKSAFMSRVFYAVMRGEDINLPVSPDSRTWLSSVETVAGNFAHGIKLSSEALGRDRAFTLPALCLSFEELVEALRRRFPESRSKVIFEPDAETVALFGSYPDLHTATADRLGFLRDRNADDLVAKAI